MKSKNKGGVAVIVLCSILIVLGLVALIVSHIAGAVTVLGGVAGIIYGAKARQRYKADVQEEADKKTAFETAQKAIIENRAAKAEAFAAALDAIPRVEIVRAETPAKRRKEKYYCKLTNITARTDIQKLFPLVVVDVETTGLKPAGNDIIEIAAIKYAAPFEPESCFTTLCKARNPIPGDASAVNHITDSMVEDSPAFSEIAASLSSYIAGCNIVGQNVQFDTDFLYACGVDMPEKNYYDTCQLAQYADKDKYLQNYKLETLLKNYGIYRNDAHRALSDAYATGLLFEKVIQDKRSISN